MVQAASTDRDDRTVEVLLATYNGERFLERQIDSILEQTYGPVRVLARDDASTDSTRSILEQAAREHANRFCVMPADAGTGNAKWNFARLMQASTAPYAALADQDDVWLPEKLAWSMEAMKKLEQTHGAETPLLVFSDLTVVDEDLSPVHPSFWQHQNINADRSNSLRHVLPQNFLTGCTALMNRALVKKASAIPESAYMHDWWIALVAAAFGYSTAVRQPTVLYRQHGNNAVGAVVHGKPSLIPRPRYHKERRAQWEMSAHQAMAFLEIFRDTLPPEKRRLVEAYVRCETSPFRVVRVFNYLRYRFFQKGLRPNLAMLWYLWDMEAAKREDAGVQS